MKINELSVADALTVLGTTPNGLETTEASRRLREFGPNQIDRPARTPLAIRLLREFVQFFSVILWIAAVLAFIAEWSAPGQGMRRIGVALIGCILVSGLFSFWQEYRVERTLNALLKLLPQQANLLRGASSLERQSMRWYPATWCCSNRAITLRRIAG
jgi:sodium/potassium-transporting ATPase subunit alpha